MSRSTKKYNCLQCNKECSWGHSKINKFCSRDCQSLWHWENTTKPSIERGEATHHSVFVLKKYLIEKFGEKCFDCPTGNTWQDKRLVLQLEHADGNSDNNMPSNLKLLCPNCHSQSEFFGCKGQGNRYKKISKRNVYLQNYKSSIAQG